MSWIGLCYLTKLTGFAVYSVRRMIYVKVLNKTTIKVKMAVYPTEIGTEHLPNTSSVRGCGRKRSWLTLDYYPGIFAWTNRKTTTKPVTVS
jgi:hypothetical protein